MRRESAGRGERYTRLQKLLQGRGYRALEATPLIIVDEPKEHRSRDNHQIFLFS